MTVPRRLLLAALASGLLAAGCAPVNRDELTKEALAADPSFASVLEKHRELVNRIETYERELALKRNTAEQAIKQMRQDLAVSAEAVRAKSAETKAKMEPDRRRFIDALAQSEGELKAKQAQRAAIGRAISQLRKSLKSSREAWTDTERARQDTHVEEMLRDAARIDREMAAIKTHVRLLKIKLLLIAF